MSDYCSECGCEILSQEDVGLAEVYVDRIREIDGSITRVPHRILVCRNCQDDAMEMIMAIMGSEEGAGEMEFDRICEASQCAANT